MEYAVCLVAEKAMRHSTVGVHTWADLPIARGSQCVGFYSVILWVISNVIVVPSRIILKYDPCTFQCLAAV